MNAPTPDPQTGRPLPDEVRPLDDESAADDPLEPPLDLDAEMPEADALDQRRAVPLDDDDHEHA